LNWSLLRNTNDPSATVEWAIVLASSGRRWSWAQIPRVDEYGGVHFEQLTAEQAAKLVPRAG